MQQVQEVRPDRIVIGEIRGDEALDMGTTSTAAPLRAERGYPTTTVIASPTTRRRSGATTRSGREIGYSHLEKLHNLDQLPPDGFEVVCFPVKVHRASAGWTRAVAIVNE